MAMMVKDVLNWLKTLHPDGRIAFVVVSIVLIGLIGYSIGHVSLSRDIQQFAIDNEMAYYNSTNGTFTWHTNVIGGAELFK